MTEWQVRLNGHEFDLEDLTHNKTLEWSIIKKEGRYYLKSTTFDSLTDADQVRKVATNILSKINGLAKLQITGFQPIEFDATARIDESGNYHHFIFASGSINFRSRMSVKGTVLKVDGTVDTSPQQQTTLIESGYSIAMHNTNVAEAVRIFGTLKNNWFNLYKIYEIVRDDVGGHNNLINTGWAQNKDDISRFTGTAQRSELIGDEARHSRMKGSPPSNPMSHSEAQALIRTILVKWISSKS